MYEGSYIGDFPPPGEKKKAMFWLMKGGLICYSTMLKPLVDTGKKAKTISEAKEVIANWLKNSKQDV